MCNDYNIAIKYLIKKYGGISCGLIPSKNEELRRATSRKKTNEIRNSLTESDYLTTYVKNNIPENHDDNTIHVLLTQYYYGVKVRNELHDKLISMNIL